MEQQHRDIITKNMESLVHKTSVVGLERLLNYLVRDGIFTADMAKKYKNRNEAEVIRKTQFFMDIQTRGPTAFEKFLSALKEVGALDLVALMQPKSRSSQLGACPLNLPNYMIENAGNFVSNLQNLAIEHPHAQINLNTEPLIVNVIPAEERLDRITSSRVKIPLYNMGSRPKGLALIINIMKFQGDVHPYREGAHLDGVKMKELFDQLGYETETYEDLVNSEFRKVLRNFAGRQEHNRVSSCMVAIFSHGNMSSSSTDLSTVIYAADGIPIKYLDIIERFNSENCPGLVNKPKVFFFQACRGSERNHSVTVANRPRTETDGFGSYPVRNLSDYLIAHATPRGYEAIRDRFTGSWFIQTVIKVFMENAWDTEVSEMLDMVDLQMRPLVSEDNGLQTTCVEKVGFRKMFINPGLYDDDETTTDSAPVSSTSQT